MVIKFGKLINQYSLKKLLTKKSCNDINILLGMIFFQIINQ
jgi:hypothetical protein